jgi:hypothetical protein
MTSTTRKKTPTPAKTTAAKAAAKPAAGTNRVGVKRIQAAPSPVQQSSPADPMALIDENAVRWLASGNRGVSSNTLFAAVTGFEAGETNGPPNDSWDFARCVRLLVVCPQFRPHLDRVAKRGAHWRALVGQWDVLEALLKEEWPALFDPKNADYRKNADTYPKATDIAMRALYRRADAQSASVNLHDLAA